MSLGGDALDPLLARIRACQACQDLPRGPKPIVQGSPHSRIVIISQAPGWKAHESGIPFHDASGDRLREWLGIDSETFYDVARVAIVPMGFCYPGRGSGGDNPPRPECAPLWHEKLLALMPAISLTLLVGGYAQARYLGKGAMTERVRDFALYLPRYFPLPNPSWRTTAWERKNPWFTAEALPALRAALPSHPATPPLPSGEGWGEG